MDRQGCLNGIPLPGNPPVGLQAVDFLNGSSFEYRTSSIAVAPLVWVPWVPGNPQNLRFKNKFYLFFQNSSYWLKLSNEFAAMNDKRRRDFAHNRLV